MELRLLWQFPTFLGMAPIGAVRVGYDGEFIVNPTVEDQYSSDLDLIYVGTKTDMLMIEGERAQLPEDDFIAALEFAHEAIQPVIAGIEELVSIAGKEKVKFPLFVLDPEIKTFVEDLIGDGIARATRIGDKQERNAAINEMKDKAEEALKEKLGEDAYNPAQLSMAMEELQEVAYRAPILATGERSGGRGPNELRELKSKVGLIPRVHGSALFPEAKLKPSCSLLSDRLTRLKGWTRHWWPNPSRLCFTTIFRLFRW